MTPPKQSPSDLPEAPIATPSPLPSQEPELADLLVSRIVDNIDGHKASDEAWVASLYGEWGVGKTRCLKAIEKAFAAELQQRLEHPPPQQGHAHDADATQPFGNLAPAALVIPIFFSAWRYEKEPHLIAPLLRSIESALRNYFDETHGNGGKGEQGVATIKEHISFWHGAWRAFSVKADLVQLALPLLGGLLEGAVPGLKQVLTAIQADVSVGAKDKDAADGGKAAAAVAGASADLESRYYDFQENLEARLREPITINEKSYQLRFLVLVDDLDRCLPDKAVEMLEAIKLFLNIPGFAFVLAIDDDVVERGIRHRYADYLGKNGAVNDEQLPITGHEYLEKIVHLPLHLPRCSSLKTVELLEKHLFTKNEAAFGVHRQALTELAQRVLPAAPRKIIRFAEAMHFHYQGLEHHCRDEAQKEKLRTLWRPLPVARSILLAQLYPEVYRQLRGGEIGDFWRWLFCLELHPGSGVLVFSDAFYIDQTAEIEEDESGETRQAPRRAAQNKPRHFTVMDLEAHQKEVSGLAKQEDADKGRRSEEAGAVAAGKDKGSGGKKEGDGDQGKRASAEAATRPLDFLVANELQARALVQFMKKARSACETRNGWGLLKLWSADERERILALPKGDRSPHVIGWLAQAKGGDAVPLTEKQYRALALDMETSVWLNDLKLEKATDGDVAFVDKKSSGQRIGVDPGSLTTASDQTGRSLSKPEQIDADTLEGETAAQPPEATIKVEEVDLWIKALLGNVADTENYSGKYRRRGAPADAEAFSRLLHAFCKLTGRQRRALCTPDWRRSVKPLLSVRQLNYLTSLIPKAPNEQRWFISDNGETVKDIQTGLEWRRLPEGMQWQGGKPVGEAVKVNWEKAKKIAEGSPGWRLPTREELQSLVDYDETGSPTIDQAIFPGTPSGGFWSISPVAGDAGYAWLVYFGNGGVYLNLLDGHYRVRLLRSAPGEGERSVVES